MTLSTGERPFQLINRRLSPVLGWAWLIATLMANIVWCMPQFNLARAAVQQNLIPAVGTGTASTLVICLLLLLVGFVANVLYQSKGRGVRLFDAIIKAMVGLIILSFVAVVATLAFKGAIQWGDTLRGLVPTPGLLFRPAEGYLDLIAQSSHPAWWHGFIVDQQRDIIIAAFGSAVGINMTWLLPYTLLRRKWGRRHRGLAIFDLSLGLFLPFFLATTCVVVAAISQFHTRVEDVPPGAGAPTLALLQAASDTVPNAVDARLADMLVRRDNFQLAGALAPLAGDFVAQKVFGLGVLGMAASTVIVLMLINGLAFQELLGRPDHRPTYLLGCAVAGLAGTAGPFVWTGQAQAAFAIPTSVLGGSLIPIAYFTFLLLMNSRPALGNSMPTGRRRLLWNTLMVIATSIATLGSVWVLWGKAGLGSWKQLLPLAGLLLLVALLSIGAWTYLRKNRPEGAARSGTPVS